MGTVANKSVHKRRRSRTGDGEIVPRRFAVAQARQTFLMRVSILKPGTCSWLHRPVMIQHFQRDKARRPAISDAFPEGVSGYGQAIAAWQDTFHLPDLWCHLAADQTVRIAACPTEVRSVLAYPDDLIDRIIWLGGPDAIANLYEGKAPEPRLSDIRTFKFTPEHLQRKRDIYLDDLKLPDEVYEPDGAWQDEGCFGVFDPRAETVDDAVKRLMPELESRLRRALETMVVEDTVGDTVPVRDLPPVRHFDWTVRYQVLEESYSRIAHTDHVDRKAVTRAVRKVADIIGLTLRDPDEGGRPVKPARCVKVTPKPGTF